MKTLIKEWLGINELQEKNEFLTQELILAQEMLSNCLDILVNLNQNLDEPKKVAKKKPVKKPVKKVSKK